MYPAAELTRLAARKAALRGDIARARVRCTVAATQLTRPVVWLQHALVFYRRATGFARDAFRRRTAGHEGGDASHAGLLRTLLHWGPVVFAVVREVRTAAKPRT